jgi:hypothetical protein
MERHRVTVSYCHNNKLPKAIISILEFIPIFDSESLVSTPTMEPDGLTDTWFPVV